MAKLQKSTLYYIILYYIVLHNMHIILELIIHNLMITCKIAWSIYFEPCITPHYSTGGYAMHTLYPSSGGITYCPTTVLMNCLELSNAGKLHH